MSLLPVSDQSNIFAVRSGSAASMETCRAATQAQLRMLRPRSSAGFGGSAHLHVRMHVLRGLCRERIPRNMPELHRQFRSAAYQARVATGPVPLVGATILARAALWASSLATQAYALITPGIHVAPLVVRTTAAVVAAQVTSPSQVESRGSSWIASSCTDYADFDHQRIPEAKARIRGEGRTASYLRPFLVLSVCGDLPVASDCVHGHARKGQVRQFEAQPALLEPACQVADASGLSQAWQRLRQSLRPLGLRRGHYARFRNSQISINPDRLLRLARSPVTSGAGLATGFCDILACMHRWAIL